MHSFKLLARINITLVLFSNDLSPADEQTETFSRNGQYFRQVIRKKQQDKHYIMLYHTSRSAREAVPFVAPVTATSIV